MSLEIFLFIDSGTVLDTDELNQISRKYEPKFVYEEKITINKNSGLIPVVMGGVKTGIETYVIPYADIVEHIPVNEKFTSKEKMVIRFRWGGDFNEGATALYTASIIAFTYNGIAFDPETATYISPEELMAGYRAFASYSE